MRSSVAVRAVILALIAATAVATGTSAWAAAIGDTWASPAQTAYTTPTLSQPGANAGTPELAMSGSTALATWYRNDGADDIVQVARSTDGGVTWGQPVNLSSPGGNATRPKVAMSGTTAIVTWSRYDGARWVVQAAASGDAGATWALPVDVSNATDDNSRPVVAVSGTRAVIAWKVNSFGGISVSASTSTDGGATWRLPALVSGINGGVGTFEPQAAMDGSYAVVTWEGDNGVDVIVQSAATSDGGITWDPAMSLSTAGADSFFPDVAFADGTALVAWTRVFPLYGTVEVRRSTDAGGTWSAAQALSVYGNDATHAQIAMAQGKAVVTWSRPDGVHEIVQAVTSADDGITWSPPIDVSDPAYDSRNAQVAFNGQTASIVWSRRNAAATIIQVASSSNAGNSWTTPTDLASSAVGGYVNLYPHVALGSNAVALWFAHNGTNYVAQAAYSAGSGGGTPGATPALAEFTYWLEDGRECTSMSPQVHEVGTVVNLPGADAPCGHDGSTVAGWRIPGQAQPLRPGRAVPVIASQQFTAVLQMPWVEVVYDSNVSAADACQASTGAEVPVAGRTAVAWIPRGQVAQQASARTAACTPPGHVLAGWSASPGGAGAFAPGAALPAPAVDEDGIAANTVRLFAVWRAAGS